MQEQARVPAIRFAGFTDAWEQRKYGDVIELLSGQDFEPSQYNEVGDGIPYMTGASCIVNGSTIENRWTLVPRCIAYQGEVLLVCKGSGYGTLARLGQEKAHIARQFMDLRCTDVLNNTFNYYLAFSVVKEIKKNARGLIAGIDRSAILKQAVSIPQLAEQEKIGQYFSYLDHLITLHQRKYSRLCNIKKSMLERMFPKERASVPEIRFAGFTDAWEQRKVSDVTNRFDNLRIPVAANLRVPGTTPYYGANGIQDYVDGFTHDGEFVLVAEDGANDLKNYPVRCVNGRIWVNNHAHVLQGKPEMADNKFLAYSISQADIESLLVGGGRAKLNAEIMMGIEFHIPSLDEQRIIGKYLTHLDHLITLHQRELERLQNIKKACLEKMFV